MRNECCGGGPSRAAFFAERGNENRGGCVFLNGNRDLKVK